jgi:hypothetical protein
MSFRFRFHFRQKKFISISVPQISAFVFIFSFRFRFSTVVISQRGPKEYKITTWPLTFRTSNLTKIAHKKSGPSSPLMACRAAPAPPQFQPGTKPLGRTGGFDAGEAWLKDLTTRRRLAHL